MKDRNAFNVEVLTTNLEVPEEIQEPKIKVKWLLEHQGRRWFFIKILKWVTLWLTLMFIISSSKRQ